MFNYAQIKQTINYKKSLISIDHLSIDQEKLEISENLLNINKVVNQYYENGFKIILFGHSLGGFSVLKYLSKFGDGKINKVIVANCRLDTPLFIINNLIKNQKLEKWVTLIYL